MTHITPSATQTPAPPAGGYLEHFARETPDAPALIEGDQTLSWAAWDERANRLADALAARGLGAGDRVAVRMENRSEWFVVEAALGKLGALRVAVSHRLSASEVRYLLAHSEARAFFFDDGDVDALAPAFEALPGLTLRVGLHGEQPDVLRYARLLEEGRPVARPTQKSTTAVVYTSGTTGRPKGVYRTPPEDEAQREALRRLALDLTRSIPVGPRERNLLACPLNHAAAPASALSTHSRGGTVYPLRKFDPEEALCLIARHRITMSFMVPTMLNRIVNLPAEVRARYDVSSLRIITTGASVCPADLKARVTAYFGPCLYESYGATEIGLITILTPADLPARAGSCGRLLEGVDVRIVGDDGALLPRGETGQIYIQTPGTMRSYLNEERQEADFTPDGYFTAGDVGKLDEDGYLYILDRKKDMIIAGGVNIYPAEIEAALREHPAVLDAAVFGVPHPDLGEQVHAVCERVPGQSVEADELASFVAERLAKYKWPRRIELVDELPRNAAGKVLKRELRAPFWAGQGRVI